MFGVLTRWGDRLLERLVPRTVAAACQEVGAQAEWWERCFCDWNTCRAVYRWCQVCGGTTHCTDCVLPNESCCG